MCSETSTEVETLVETTPAKTHAQSETRAEVAADPEPNLATPRPLPVVGKMPGPMLQTMGDDVVLRTSNEVEGFRYSRLKGIWFTFSVFLKLPLLPLWPFFIAKEAKDWFGAQPPDMSVIARSRSAPGQGSGADYLYTYLRTYYRDPNTATGWNNFAFPTVGMPHVLWQLQGERRPVFETRQEHGHEAQVFTGRWEQVSPGTMSPQAYDDAVADLVAFLQWMSEPVAQFRVRLGVWVMLFLAVFTLIAWRLNAAYWKDIK